MNTITISNAVIKLEKAIKKASRTLLEFEAMQAKWEVKKGLGKTYSRASYLMRTVNTALRRN